jgi:hypothetical protein
MVSCFLHEDGGRAGFRNIAIHLKLKNGQSPKKSCYELVLLGVCEISQFVRLPIMHLLQMSVISSPGSANTVTYL